jgi:hypothetical protein
MYLLIVGVTSRRDPTVFSSEGSFALFGQTQRSAPTNIPIPYHYPSCRLRLLSPLSKWRMTAGKADLAQALFECEGFDQVDTSFHPRMAAGYNVYGEC